MGWQIGDSPGMYSKMWVAREKGRIPSWPCIARVFNIVEVAALQNMLQAKTEGSLRASHPSRSKERVKSSFLPRAYASGPD